MHIITSTSWKYISLISYVNKYGIIKTYNISEHCHSYKNKVDDSMYFLSWKKYLLLKQHYSHLERDKHMAWVDFIFWLSKKNQSPQKCNTVDTIEHYIFSSKSVKPTSSEVERNINLSCGSNWKTCHIWSILWSYTFLCHKLYYFTWKNVHLQT